MSPIELGFSVFKRNLQRTNMTGLSDSAFVHIVGEALAGWSVRSARNSFIHCGFKVDRVEDEERARRAKCRRSLMAALAVVLHAQQT